MRRSRDRLALHNERVRLLSGWVNNLGLGFIGFAVLRPLVDGTVSFDWFFAAWAATGLAFHAAAHYILRYLEKDTTDDSL